MRATALVVLVSSFALLTACGSATGSPDAGTDDAGTADAGPGDAGQLDAGAGDAGAGDAGQADAGTGDAGAGDAGAVDGGATDAGAVDAGNTDAGSADAGAVDAGCPPAAPLVAPGGTLTPRPTGSALRLTFIYQDMVFAIDGARGVDMVLPGSQGPFTPGVNSGYWVETRDAADQPLYTRAFMDPTLIEAVLPDGGFGVYPAPVCAPKYVYVDVPNNPLAKLLVVFGSPYGTVQPAGELARFHLP